MAEGSQPQVFIAGAGPGSPGLLTLRTAEVLAKADLVLYDQLVPKRLLDFARPGAELICVRDLPGQHPDKYPHIHSLLIDRARAGQTVVRLKGGDPLIFGRGGEETETLRAAGINYEIIPGVTAALAAAAYLDIPLTHRHAASAVALVTGHELPNKPGNKLDWAALAKFPGTLVIYMGIARLPLLLNELLRHGKDPATPALIVERASTGDMRTITSTLADLETDRRNAGLEAPGLVMIGDAIARRPDFSWFELRPLFGKRVLVTRPAHQARSMIERLELLGAVATALPTMSLQPPADCTALDAALSDLAKFDWIVFTSANGVTHFFERLFASRRDLRAVRSRLAAIGPATAEALAKYYLKADVIPERDYSSRGLVQALKPVVAGKSVLIVRANRGSEVLPQVLSEVANVTQVVAYNQVDRIDTADTVFDALRRGEIEFVMLSSSNIARGFLAACDEIIRNRILRNEVKLVVISAETGTAVQNLGFPVAGEADEATGDGLINEVVRLAKITH